MDNQLKANLLIEKANVLHAGGDKLGAAPMYREAAELFAPYASFMLVAADSFAEHGRHRDAATAYRSVLDAHPDHDQAAAGLKKANKAIEKAARKNSDLSDLRPATPVDEQGGVFKKLFKR